MNQSLIIKSFLSLLIIVIVSIPLSAQLIRLEKQTAKFYNEVSSEDPKEFELLKAPAEWVDKPVVILAQKIHNTYTYNRDYCSSKNYHRKRILIQDKSEIDDFSQYYFQKSLLNGLTHIKSDGTVHEIDLIKAIRVETEVPIFYRSSYSSDTYYKIAIPNMEAGDILDYYKVFTGGVNPYVEIYTTLAEEYPIVHQEMIYDAHQGYLAYSNNFYGAPEFKKEIKTTLFQGKKMKNTMRFTMIDTKREIVESERWDYSYKRQPMYKLFLIPKSTFTSRIYKDWDVDVNNSILPIKKAYQLTDPIYSSESIRGNVMTQLKRVETTDNLEIIEIIYKALRLKFLVLVNSDIPSSTVYKGDTYALSRNYSEMRSVYFASTFGDLLERAGINCEIVALVPRARGSIEDIVVSSEAEYGIYVPSYNKYYWTPDNFNPVGATPEEMYGANGISSPYEDFGKTKTKKPITIPLSKSSENYMNSDIDIEISEDNLLTLKNENTFIGQYKRIYARSYIFHKNYLYDEVLKTLEPSRRKKIKENLQNTLDRDNNRAQMAEYEEMRLEILKNLIEDDFTLEEITAYELINTGIESIEEPLHATYTFTNKDLIKKAGPNLIFDVGKLIGGQVQLSEEEIAERKSDVELGFAKEITNNITINIPEGKTVSGYEQLNMNIDNEDGAFISTATLEDGVLKITTTKTYKNQTVPKERWSNMVAMLEAGYEFTQMKIILKESN